MSEVRVDLDPKRVLRVLVGLGPDDRPELLLADNKAGVGNPWTASTSRSPTPASTPIWRLCAGRRRTDGERVPFV